MKIFRLFIVLASSVLISSCIKEDMSDCYPTGDNLSLEFKYTGNTTDDESWFNKMIDNVGLYVFDEGGNYLSELTQVINKANLTSEDVPGTTLRVPGGGRYTIVCWGNVGGSTLISNPSPTGGTVNHPNYDGTRSLNTQDHNYYGTLTVDVPASGKVGGVVRFRSAHINMEVCIKNLVGKEYASMYPKVEVHYAMPQYNFFDMSSIKPFSQSYTPSVGWSDSDNGNLASLALFRFMDDNPIVVVVKDYNGKSLASVNLRQTMLDGEITVEKLNEASVKLILEFDIRDMSVVVRIEGWSKNVAIPDLLF